MVQSSIFRTAQGLAMLFAASTIPVSSASAQSLDVNTPEGAYVALIPAAIAAKQGDNAAMTDITVRVNRDITELFDSNGSNLRFTFNYHGQDETTSLNCNTFTLAATRNGLVASATILSLSPMHEAAMGINSLDATKEAEALNVASSKSFFPYDDNDVQAFTGHVFTKPDGSLNAGSHNIAYSDIARAEGMCNELLKPINEKISESSQGGGIKGSICAHLRQDYPDYASIAGCNL